MRLIAASVLALATALSTLTVLPPIEARQAALQTPEQFFGFRMGTDNQLARWDRMVEYLKGVDAWSDRVRLRELGPSTLGNPFIVLEIASPETLASIAGAIRPRS